LLAAFPQVLAMTGDAILAERKNVKNAVHGLRNMAKDAG